MARWQQTHMIKFPAVFKTMQRKILWKSLQKQRRWISLNLQSAFMQQQWYVLRRTMKAWELSLILYLYTRLWLNMFISCTKLMDSWILCVELHGLNFGPGKKIQLNETEQKFEEIWLFFSNRPALVQVLPVWIKNLWGSVSLNNGSDFGRPATTLFYGLYWLKLSSAKVLFTFYLMWGNV